MGGLSWYKPEHIAYKARNAASADSKEAMLIYEREVPELKIKLDAMRTILDKIIRLQVKYQIKRIANEHELGGFQHDLEENKDAEI